LNHKYIGFDCFSVQESLVVI